MITYRIIDRKIDPISGIVSKQRIVYIVSVDNDDKWWTDARPSSAQCLILKPLKG